MLKINGTFIAMKGQKIDTEIVEAKNAIKLTGAKIISEKEFDLPFEYGKRNIIIIKKDRHVSGYPRSYQQMLKKPL